MAVGPVIGLFGRHYPDLFSVRLTRTLKALLGSAGLRLGALESPRALGSNSHCSSPWHCFLLLASKLGSARRPSGNRYCHGPSSGRWSPIHKPAFGLLV